MAMTDVDKMLTILIVCGKINSIISALDFSSTLHCTLEIYYWLTAILQKRLDALLLCFLLHLHADKKSLFVGLFQCVLECRAPP
jgi:hypothetical protein